MASVIEHTAPGERDRTVPAPRRRSAAPGDLVAGHAPEWGSVTSIRVVCDRPGDGRGGHRDFDTRAGTIDVAIPKLRNGSHFPTGYGSLAAAPNEH